LKKCSVANKNLKQLSNNEALRLQQCLGYIDGFWDGLKFSEASQRAICLEKITSEDLLKVSIKWVEGHPARRYDLVHDLVRAVVGRIVSLQKTLSSDQRSY